MEIGLVFKEKLGLDSTKVKKAIYLHFKVKNRNTSI